MVNSERHLEGVVPIIPTTFHQDERIDFDGIARCVRFAVECGVDAVCLPAYGSEFYKLNDQERQQVVGTAIAAAQEKIQVIAQSNHPSSYLASELAKRYQDMGASLISFAIPRTFALRETDVLEYCERICRAVELPVLIQDFNPGGATVGASFATSLHDQCSNFQYLKLEEPLMSAKVRAIRQATEDRVGILEGWGGMYLLELVQDGICGVMPGLGVADLLQKVWFHAKNSNLDDAMELFQNILPQLVFTLQNMEFFLHMEKELLVARGVLDASSRTVRRATWTPDKSSLDHGIWLNQRLVKLVESGP